MSACLLALVGIVLGGCSMSLPVASLVVDEGPDTTSTVRVKAISPLSPELGEEDWRRAKGALVVALDPQGDGSAVSWDNPKSAMKGTVTPVGLPFVKSDDICRAFRSTVVGQTSTFALEGTACRPSGGEWTIKVVKPGKKHA